MLSTYIAVRGILSGMQLGAARQNEGMQRTEPPFRADQVGSPLRPPVFH
jgi:hypothetical protein